MGNAARKRGLFSGGQVSFRDGCLGELFGDHKHMRENRSLGSARPIVGTEGRLDFNSLGNVQKGSIGDEGGMQVGELL